jgi:hypothetical protein
MYAAAAGVALTYAEKRDRIRASGVGAAAAPVMKGSQQAA